MVAFGKQPLYVKRTENIVLHNARDSVLRIAQIALGGGDENVFSLQNDCGQSLGAGKECRISLSFEPTSEGDRSAEVRVETAGRSAGTRSRPVYAEAPATRRGGIAGNRRSSGNGSQTAWPCA